MTAYLWLALLSAGTIGLLWLMRLRGPLLTLAAAAVAFGCAGYALQGSPGLPEASRAAGERTPPISLTMARRMLMGQFDNADNWLTISEALASRGNSQDAANILRSAVREHPGDFKLWVGLGNALADHAHGLSPAARFAFGRAQQLAPGHPAPAFFLGLAAARSGNPEEAVALWQGILARAPANASWRPLVEDAVLAMAGVNPPR
ncbi:MAG: tetratricopeptide repeat protein [Sphingomonas sp.]|uniref:tetratricopeptide repeat protein n=1 Tax=Sphingomonas sp. TaxID=28214 RepID=UPI0017E702C4|nr:tetratricopeptide repeat protein [Sphingomonas sp.]MBA3668413.1 tetratricopeptide repeat protein [Sphingomonas sp.]